MKWQPKMRIPTIVRGAPLTSSGPQDAAEGDGLIRG